MRVFPFAPAIMLFVVSESSFVEFRTNSVGEANIFTSFIIRKKPKKAAFYALSA